MLTLHIDETQELKLVEKAASVGLSADQLLQIFVADLVEGEGGNGPEQREILARWFDSCPFSDELRGASLAKDMETGSPIIFF